MIPALFTEQKSAYSTASAIISERATIKRAGYIAPMATGYEDKEDSLLELPAAKHVPQRTSNRNFSRC